MSVVAISYKLAHIINQHAQQVSKPHTQLYFAHIIATIRTQYSPCDRILYSPLRCCIILLSSSLRDNIQHNAKDALTPRLYTVQRSQTQSTFGRSDYRNMSVAVSLLPAVFPVMM